MRTLADTEITSRDGRIKASEILVVRPPTELRIEVLTMFGVAWILATDGEVLHVYSREEGTVYRGKPTPDLIRHYLPVPLELAELTELLLGRPPRRDGAVPTDVSWEAETRLVRLTLSLQGGGTEQIWFEANTGLLTRCEERSSDGALRFDLRIKAYSRIEGRSLASNLTIVGPDDVRVRLSYARSELDPDLPEGVFRLGTLAGAREKKLTLP